MRADDRWMDIASRSLSTPGEHDVPQDDKIHAQRLKAAYRRVGSVPRVRSEQSSRLLEARPRFRTAEHTIRLGAMRGARPDGLRGRCDQRRPETERRVAALADMAAPGFVFPDHLARWSGGRLGRGLGVVPRKMP